MGAADENGRFFGRQHDAEFKLLAGFFSAAVAAMEHAASWEGRGVLWSKKPLCRSCAGAVQQLKTLCPRLTLDIIYGNDQEFLESPCDDDKEVFPPSPASSEELLVLGLPSALPP